MRNAKRGFGPGRKARTVRASVAACLISSVAIALAGCGSDGAGSAATSATSPFATADAAMPASGTANGAGGSTPGGTNGTGSTTPPPAAATSTSVTLSWQPPTQNSNGSPITDLAGYVIHYGTASAAYTQLAKVQNAGLTRFVLDNLAKGTYYFAITAYNSKGLESELSGEVTATLN
jgi:fibronectin type III domain protein